MAVFDTKPIVFHLYFDDESRLFLFEAYHKEKPVAIRQALAKLAIKAVPAVLENASSWPLRLDPSQFLLVRDWLIRLRAQISEKKALCAVSGLAMRMRYVTVPDWFRFVFVQRDGGLLCELPKDVAALEEGWFLCGESLWRCKLNREEDELARHSLAGMELVRLLRDTLPDWTRRSIPYECPLSLTIVHA